MHIMLGTICKLIKMNRKDPADAGPSLVSGLSSEKQRFLLFTLSQVTEFPDFEPLITSYYQLS